VKILASHRFKGVSSRGTSPLQSLISSLTFLRALFDILGIVFDVGGMLAGRSLTLSELLAELLQLV
jgi:hypothetical protein